MDGMNCMAKKIPIKSNEISSGIQRAFRHYQSMKTLTFSCKITTVSKKTKKADFIE